MHATVVQNTSQQPPASFRIGGSSEPTPSLFAISDSSEWPLACRQAMVSLSSHLTFQHKRANEPWTMSPPFFLLLNDTSRMQPRPLEVSAQQAGESKKCYTWKAMQQSGPYTISQWVQPSNGPPTAHSRMLSILRPTLWTWSNANGKNWA